MDRTRRESYLVGSADLEAHVLHSTCTSTIVQAEGVRTEWVQVIIEATGSKEFVEVAEHAEEFKF